MVKLRVRCLRNQWGVTERERNKHDGDMQTDDERFREGVVLTVQ